MPVVQSGGRTGPHGASRAASLTQGREDPSEADDARPGKNRVRIGSTVGHGGAAQARAVRRVERSGAARGRPSCRRPQVTGPAQAKQAFVR